MKIKISYSNCGYDVDGLHEVIEVKNGKKETSEFSDAEKKRELKILANKKVK